MRILPMGDHAVLVEDPPGGPMAWSEGLRAEERPDVVDIVPAATTVLVRWIAGAPAAFRSETLGTVRPRRVVAGADAVVIPVRYDGPDLHAVADALGRTAAEVVGLHSGCGYEVAFCGFAPGFAYLVGLPGVLHLPRRATPRTAVPAGSVAIAAGYSAVYPRESPGGWHLIGSTDLVLFDPDREPPALLSPGTRVRFEPA